MSLGQLVLWTYIAGFFYFFISLTKKEKDPKDNLTFKECVVGSMFWPVLLVAITLMGDL